MSSSAIRVVRVITRLNIGGPSIHAVTLADRLEAFGFTTLLLHGRLADGEGDMSYLLEGTNVRATYLHEMQRAVAPLSDLPAIRRIYRLLCEFRPAIVHTHMAKAGALGRVAAVLYNRTAGRHSPTRIVHTYHGHVLEGYFGPAKTNLFLRTERALARAADRIVAISPRVKRELVEDLRIGRRTQYEVIPLGFDLEPLARVDAAARAAARAVLQLPAEAPVITTLGRLTAIKQHDLFLEMAALVRQRVPAAIFLVVGDGELRPDIVRRAKSLGLEGVVRFLGWRRDLDVIYGATDVFALTSRNEGTPVALIEAMAAGVPGVSTDVGGVADVIVSPEVGTRVSQQTAAALADAVVALLESPHRAERGERARQAVLARFGLDRLVRDVANLYTAMLTHSDA